MKTFSYCVPTIIIQCCYWHFCNPLFQPETTGPRSHGADEVYGLDYNDRSQVDHYAGEKGDYDVDFTGEPTYDGQPYYAEELDYAGGLFHAGDPAGHAGELYSTGDPDPAVNPNYVGDPDFAGEDQTDLWEEDSEGWRLKDGR